MDRRFFLRGLGTVACSAAAHPWLTTVTLAQGAAAFGDNRLVVVILRGAMDGLDVVQPRGDAGTSSRGYRNQHCTGHTSSCLRVWAFDQIPLRPQCNSAAFWRATQRKPQITQRYTIHRCIYVHRYI